MKTMNALRLFVTISVLAGVACTPKNKPRQVHEPARQWTPTQTPDDPSVDASDFGTFDLPKAYKALGSADPQNNMKTILLPLSSFVLNQRIVENPRYRTSRLSQMIHVFHQALLTGLDAKDQSGDFKALKEKYYATVFSGCSADLRRDCANVSLFSSDSRFMRIMTRLAQEMDALIEPELKTHGTPAKCVEKSETCRYAIEERYRRLAMANMSRHRLDDGEFSFAYLKYSRLFSALIDFDRAKNNRQPGYIAEVHGKIFEAIISKYNPTNTGDTEFRKFVENFNPWIYSQKQADTFQNGTKTMFKFGAECCLYENAQKTSLSPAVRTAIEESQKFTAEEEDFAYDENPDNRNKSGDSFGPSFYLMVKRIQKKFGNSLFVNMGMEEEIGQISSLNSPFYNEYFLVVDRLFRGHLNSAEVEMVLRNTPSARTQEYLPKVISTYVKVNMIYLVVRTNRFMTSIYTSNIASDKVFEEATSRSRELTSAWHTVQSQVDLLERVMGSYFKGQNLFSMPFLDTTRMIKAINRNIHYVSVWPNMIVMNYFLAKMKGAIIINTWWGKIEINADTILDAFFDGVVTTPWFRFGKDPEQLDRQMLLYAWDYMLRTGSLNGIDNEKFFELIYTKYVDDNLHDLRKRITEFERGTYGHFNFNNVDALCEYEMNNRRLPPAIRINFLELNRYTYSGLGDNGTNALLNKLLGEPASVISYYREQVDTRTTYLRAMLDLIEHDLIRQGKIQKLGEKHAVTEKAYETLKEFELLKVQMTKLFVPRHEYLFNCAIRLQEIERRRANRLYDEERAYLGRIFDEMRPLVKITDKAALEEKVKELNERLFKGGDTRFDSIHGLTFRMSKYDLLMRNKKRIEADIFTNVTEEEKRQYGASLSWYVRPRNVSVFMPEGLVRDDMMTQETANTIFMSGDTAEARQAFIRDGMAAFNGKTGSFIEWQGQRAGDRGLSYYLNSLMEFYLLGPVVDETGTKHEVTAANLSDAFVKVYASYTLDETDIRNAVDFKNDGRFERSFYVNTFFEENGSRLPFFYALMLQTKGRAGTNIEGRTQGATAAADAFQFAQTIINLRTLIFPASEGLVETVKKNYGTRANDAFRRVNELFDHLAAKEESVKDVANLDPRLKMPFYLQEGRAVVWYSPNMPMVDALKRNDHKIQIEDFARRTDNFYKTRESVKVQ